jgi:hypothetical protein
MHSDHKEAAPVSSDREKLILRPGPVVETIERLVARIFERFGNCGLYKLHSSRSRKGTRRAGVALARHVWLRALVSAACGGYRGLGWMLTLIDGSVFGCAGHPGAANLTVSWAPCFPAQAGEEASKPSCSGRYWLRSIVHVIDMHQLTRLSKFIVRANTPRLSAPCAQRISR